LVAPSGSLKALSESFDELRTSGKKYEMMEEFAHAEALEA
jgi:hypothetical protein